MKICTIVFCFIVMMVSVVSPVHAAGGPQDNWYSVTNWTGYSSPMGMALGTNGNIFVAEMGANQIRVIDVDGNTITNWTGFNQPRDVAVSTVNGLVYVSDSGNNMIKVFDHDGNSVTNWGVAGTNDAEFSTPTTVNILPAGNVVIADGGNYRIQIFDPMGGFIRKWGEMGVFDGQFRDIEGHLWAMINAEVGVDGLIYVNGGNGGGGAGYYNRLQFFEEDGQYVGKYLVSRHWLAPSYISRSLKDFVYNKYYSSGTCVNLGESGAFVQTLVAGYDNCGHVLERTDGTLYLSFGNGIRVFKRYYRQKVYNPDSNNDVPVPVLIKAQQRPGTTWMDIDYIVHDGDDTNVTVAALAFVDSGTDLGSIVKMSTFVENSATNLGVNIPTGVSHHLTWNVAADWSVEYSDVQIEVLAHDTRDLMDFRFITIPSNGVNAELTINKSMINAADLLHVWMWLIATDDSGIELVSGAVIGQSGIYAGKTLASGTSTTTDGRAFVFERFNVVEVTAGEKQQAIDARAIIGNESTYWVKSLP